MGTWLDNFNPSSADRVRLLEYLMIGMVSCNIKLHKDSDKDGWVEVQTKILTKILCKKKHTLKENQTF